MKVAPLGAGVADSVGTDYLLVVVATNGVDLPGRMLVIVLPQGCGGVPLQLKMIE